VVRFGRSAAAEEAFTDVKDGIRQHVSVGYRVHKMRLEEERQTLRKYFVQDDPATRLTKYQERNRSIDGLPVTPPDLLPYR
jgi:hypothetical protein